MMSKKRKVLRKLLLSVLMVGTLSFIGCVWPGELTESERNSIYLKKIVEYCFNNHTGKHADEACEKNPALVRHGKCILNTVSQTFSSQNPVFFRGLINLDETGKISYFRLDGRYVGSDSVVHWPAHPEDNGSYIHEIHVGNNSAYLELADTQQEQPTPSTLFWFTTTRLNGVDIVFLEPQ